jgi:tRNA-dihydrouridine synthase
VKDAVNIPVIGNGDVLTPEDAQRMIELTNCDGVMIGRGVLGNPWLVKQTVDFLSTGEYDKDINFREKIKWIIDHTERLIELKGEYIALLEMRSHASWYVKGLKGATRVKREINNIKSKEELYKLLYEYLDYLEKGPK